MSDRTLRRVVWLTAEQREHLLDCAMRALATEGADIEQCAALVHDLVHIEESTSGQISWIRSVARAMRLAPDSLPVQVSDIQVEQVLVLGGLNTNLAKELSPTFWSRRG